MKSDVDEFQVSIGIHGEDLDPDRVTALMRCEPAHAHRRGEWRGPGRPTWPRGAWLADIRGVAPTEPESALAEILSKLPSEPAIWNGLRERFTIRLGFGLFLDASHRGFELSPAIVQRVGGLGLDLGFDIYGPEGPTIGGPADEDEDDDDEDEREDAGTVSGEPAPEPPPRRGRLITFGGKIDKTQATLRIHGEHADPDEISSLLQAAPTEVVRRGSLRGRSEDPARDAWLLSVHAESPTQPEGVLERLLSQLPADTTILDRVREHHHVSLLLELHLFTCNRGFDLSPALVRRLGRLRLGLAFDIHASHDPSLQPPRTYDDLGWRPRSEP